MRSGLFIARRLVFINTLEGHFMLILWLFLVGFLIVFIYLFTQFTNKWNFKGSVEIKEAAMRFMFITNVWIWFTYNFKCKKQTIKYMDLKYNGSILFISATKLVS